MKSEKKTQRKINLTKKKKMKINHKKTKTIQQKKKYKKDKREFFWKK